MAVQGVLTLNTKAYNPRGKTGDVALWALVGDTSFGGATSTVDESVRGPTKDGLYRSKFQVKIPKAATSDTSCACTGQEIARGLANIEMVIPSAFTAAERDDFTKRVQALVAHAVFTSAATNLESSW